MISGEDTIHDIWHWKAYRTNTLGFLDDKRHLVTTTETLRAAKIITLDGGTIWLKRPRDEGKPPYILTDPYEYQGDSIPKYTLQTPTNSAADVTGKGAWLDGEWTLEAIRKFDTGHHDDYTFVIGETVKMAISVFNNTVAQIHSVSGIIELELEE